MEVQNRGTSGPPKRTCVHQKLLKKKERKVADGYFFLDSISRSRFTGVLCVCCVCVAITKSSWCVDVVLLKLGLVYHGVSEKECWKGEGRCTSTSQGYQREL